MAKRGEPEVADDESGDDGDDKKSKKAKQGKRPRRLGPRTVAKPCLVGAVVLTALGAVLPR